MKELHIGKSAYKIVNISSGKFGSDINGHSHGSESYEIHFCFEGGGELITDNNSFSLCENSLYITGPNIWHRQVINKENPLNEICLYIQKTSTGTDVLSSAFNATHFWIGQANESIKNLFTQLHRIAYQKSLYAKEKQTHLSELIVTELSFLYSPELIINDSDTPDDKKFVIIENAFIFDYMNITLPELSKRLGLSPRQTQRVLRQYYGMNFRDKQINARMEAALMKLKEGKTVNEISFEVGYADSPSFIRTFKNYYGKTPSQMQHIRHSNNDC